MCSSSHCTAVETDKRIEGKQNSANITPVSFYNLAIYAFSLHQSKHHQHHKKTLWWKTLSSSINQNNPHLETTVRWMFKSFAISLISLSTQQLVLVGANSERRTRNILILNSIRLHLREDNKPSSYCWSWGGRRGSRGREWSPLSASQSWRCRRRICEPRGRATQTAGLSPSWRSGRPEQFLLCKGTFWICHLSKLAFCQNQHNQ